VIHEIEKSFLTPRYLESEKLLAEMEHWLRMNDVPDDPRPELSRGPGWAYRRAIGDAVSSSCLCLVTHHNPGSGSVHLFGSTHFHFQVEAIAQGLDVASQAIECVILITALLQTGDL
jgi:hypothetical protein